MNYKNILVIIEAFRIGIDDIPDWAMDRVSSNDIILLSPTTGRHSPFEHMNDTYCNIKTHRGRIEVDHGDWIILKDGKLDFCEASLFFKTYTLNNI